MCYIANVVMVTWLCWDTTRSREGGRGLCVYVDSVTFTGEHISLHMGADALANTQGLNPALPALCCHCLIGGWRGWGFLGEDGDMSPGEGEKEGEPWNHQCVSSLLHGGSVRQA